MSKRGIIEVGFAWIFILIAGAVILGLFSYIAMNQSDFFMDMLQTKMLTDLNTIFVGSQVSKDTAGEFDIPKTKLSFDCDSYSIGRSNFPLGDRFIFAPPEIESAKLIAWSKKWSLGFRVTNFLYITNPFIKYYIVYDEDDPDNEKIVDYILEDLPSQIEVVAFSEDSLDPNDMIINENYDRIHVLLIGEYHTSQLAEIKYDPDNFKNYDDDEIIFIVADKAEFFGDVKDSLFYANVTFKNKQQQNITPRIQIMDLSALHAAFLSGNEELFTCKFEKAMEKAIFVTKLYRKRVMELTGTACEFELYINAPTTLEKMISDLDTKPLPWDQILGDVRALENQNDVLEQKTCPLIY